MHERYVTPLSEALYTGCVEVPCQLEGVPGNSWKEAVHTGGNHTPQQCWSNKVKLLSIHLIREGRKMKSIYIRTYRR